MKKQEKTTKELTQSQKNELAGQKIFGKHLEEKNNQTQPQNQTLDVELSKLKEELSKLKAENFNLRARSALEKSGCIKPELAMKALPADCEDIQEWVDNFKSENDILFKSEAVSHGGSFKPTQCSNLSPVEIMNNYIRGIN